MLSDKITHEGGTPETNEPPNRDRRIFWFVALSLAIVAFIWSKTDSITGLTTALVFVGSAQAWVYFKQSKIMEIQAKLTRDSITAGQKSSEQQLRAYITVRKITLEEIANGLHARIEFVNGGQTPAYNVKVRVSNRICGFPCKVKFLDILPPWADDGSKWTSGPSHPGFAQINIPLSREQIEELRKNQNNRLYIFGEIQYDDAFGHSWHTRLCEFSEWKTEPPNMHGIIVQHWITNLHWEYNDSN